MRAKHITEKIIEKLREGPGKLLSYAIPFLRGTCYVMYYRLFRPNVRIRMPFYVHDRVHISGPGSVFIDWGCHARKLSYDRLSIVTLTPEARVEIGRRCNFGALMIRCSKRVTIGAHVMSANCLVQDTPYITPHDAASEAGCAAAEVTIGDGVWISDMTMILAGSSIGAHSVISRGSVCHAYRVPEQNIVFGNPVFGSLDITRLDALLRLA